MKSVENPYSDKIYFPVSGITKGDLIRYYEEIADYMLPYLQDRPLTMHRFPNGIAKQGFYQKNASDYFPNWIKTEKIKKEGGWVNHVICNDQETLRYLAGQGTITFHVTLSKTDKLNYPDKLIFDLDPSGLNFKSVMNAAQILRNLLEEELKLSTYVMLTGSKGVHLVIPLMCVENFDEVRHFAKKVARYLAEKYPEDFTIEMRKDQRKGRLFLDYLRNSYAQTAVCPFSIRAFESAPVAVPISWDELAEMPNSRAYTIHTIFNRLREKPNPWKDFGKNAKILSNANKKLEILTNAQVEADTISKSI
ncbi:MAG: non-homologous end-joining DNA ligase [Eudoraea sp.]|uniref:non-homologous end-joining DNA ligase n=1 Tax=Eudoraea sp. TaxID=1979955 RepID=UPI003C73DB56